MLTTSLGHGKILGLAMPNGYTIKSEIRLAAKRAGADKAIAALPYGDDRGS
jgi:uncharacterized membrane protein (Fun14 family)